MDEPLDTWSARVAMFEAILKTPLTEQLVRQLTSETTGISYGWLKGDPGTEMGEVSDLGFHNSSVKGAGFVYVFKGTHKGVSRFKIGKANRISDRRKLFEVKIPFDVELVAAFRVINAVRLEADLHHAFSSSRVGGEWFDLSERQFHRLCLIGIAKECEDIADVQDDAISRLRESQKLTDDEYIDYLETQLVMNGICFDSDKRKAGAHGS